ncbi:alpha/beta hydrolase [Maribellus sp. YY47]|uniref:alpha/beta hydrolase n=1 Tax=Maribellus sp. YY47 TaxID=2929486 RepID=UPI002001CD4F|nr:alpha/beta hydrolase [Maribellus sp. YY47]MCK3683006.1 alpha/beta hydrolase [Maribellus sp. YY47]
MESKTDSIFHLHSFARNDYIHQKKDMRRYWLVSFVFIALSILTHAQGRYQSVAFDEISTETVTYATKDGENLDLDIYLPQGDAETERATIIFVHGGGFSGGTRNSEKVVNFCNEMASHGYVVASISYRLLRKGTPEGFGCLCPANVKLNTIDAAVEDLQDATFFLIENREQYAIDPQRIILAGSSAGAETVLAAAYKPPYCYGLDSGPVSFAGVISMAGAIADTTVLYDESAVPSLLFHGTDDNLVPYATAPHRYCGQDDPGYLMMNGSYTIAEKLEKLGVPFWLHTSCGAAHEIANKPMTDYVDEVVDFCYDFVIKGVQESRRTIVPGVQKDPKYEQFDFCED